MLLGPPSAQERHRPDGTPSCQNCALPRQPAVLAGIIEVHVAVLLLAKPVPLKPALQFRLLLAGGNCGLAP